MSQTLEIQALKYSSIHPLKKGKKRFLCAHKVASNSMMAVLSKGP